MVCYPTIEIVGSWMKCPVGTCFPRSNGTIQFPAHDFNHGHSISLKELVRPNGTLQSWACFVCYHHVMAHSLSKIILHVVFSTKDRENSITDSLRPRVHAYLAQVVRSLGCEVHILGGVADHVHLAIDFPRAITVADFLKKIKGSSSKWIKEQGPEHQKFAWQVGYGAFSVSASHKAKLIQYIANQEEHHRKESFQDEFRKLIKKYGIVVDETYLWD
jgi:REP element-mobilizing transposase RayT